MATVVGERQVRRDLGIAHRTRGSRVAGFLEHEGGTDPVHDGHVHRVTIRSVRAVIDVERTQWMILSHSFRGFRQAERGNRSGDELHPDRLIGSWWQMLGE